MALFIDLETSGFPDRFGLPYGQNPIYTDVKKYDSSRIVQICMMLCDEKYNEIETKEFIVKVDFEIPNSHIHNITNEISNMRGIIFEDGIKSCYDILKRASHIFAHNSNFDVNILKSELYRYGLKEILEEVDKKEVVCTMKEKKFIVNIPDKYNVGVKDPSLAELYKTVMKENISNAHNAKYDVINLQKTIKKLFEINKFKKNIVLKVIS
jgi:DNA polymerase-3 subunit alpha